MITLLIEHPITDYPTWRQAFDGFAEHRQASGVRDERVGRPVSGPEAVVVELDFASVPEAASFLEFLETSVWSSPTAAPALAGRPRTAIFERVTA